MPRRGAMAKKTLWPPRPVATLMPMKVMGAEFIASAGTAAVFPKADLPEIAFAGRSNVGKSSLINALLARRRLARTSNTPGRTQTINFYRINEAFSFVDLPGYGYAAVPDRVRRAWGPLIEGYLAAREQLRGAVLLVDARHPPTEKDLEMREYLDFLRIPHVIAWTKADRVPRGQRASQAGKARAFLGLPDPALLHPVSAVTGDGLKDLWRGIAALLERPPRSGSPPWPPQESALTIPRGLATLPVVSKGSQGPHRRQDRGKR